MRLPIRSFVVLGALSFGALGACTPARSGASHASAALVDAPRPAASPKPSQQYPRPSGVELASRLTPLQFEVTQHAGTEPPFQNAY
jgi:hypothetical protein